MLELKRQLSVKLVNHELAGRKRVRGYHLFFAAAQCMLEDLEHGWNVIAETELFTWLQLNISSFSLGLLLI